MGHYDDCWESYDEKQKRLSIAYRKEIDEELDKMSARELETMSKLASNCGEILTIASLIKNL